MMYVARPIRRIAEPGEAGHTAICADWKTAMTQVASVGDRMFVQEFCA